MTTAIDFVTARDAELSRRKAKRAAPTFRPRLLDPKCDPLPPAVRDDLLADFPDVLPGLEGWTVADRHARLLRVRVVETELGVFDWQATYTQQPSPSAA